MPIGNEAPLCSDFARSIDLLPCGSGLFLDRVVLVSTPLPWPKPALKHDLLAGAQTSVAGSMVRTRLFASEPTPAQQSAVMVEVFERQGAGAYAYQWHVDSGDEVASLVDRIASTDVGALDNVGDQVEVGPTFLVCTQGSHDSCCGTSGVALADEIETKRSGYSVRRVSHTGGHRFSPTLLAFPEGRMWAFADLALVDRIATNQTTAEDHTKLARGWWGAKVGPTQVAECAVRAARVGSPFVAPHIEASEVVEGDPVSGFEISVDGTQWHVDVRVEREVPSIACKSPGGLPAKPGREFSWVLEQR